MDYRDKLVVALLKDCGLKPSQIKDLIVSCFDGRTLVCKSSHRRGVFARIAIPEHVKPLLHICSIGKDRGDYIIQGCRSDSISLRSIQRIAASRSNPKSSGRYSSGIDLFNSLVIEELGEQDEKDVYLIQSIKSDGSKSLKIGISSNPARRLKHLKHSRADIDETLEIKATIKGGGRRVEIALHQMFWDSHMDGEWFEYSRDIARAFTSYTKNQLIRA